MTRGCCEAVQAVVGAFIPFAIDLGMKIARNVVHLPLGL